MEFSPDHLVLPKSDAEYVLKEYHKYAFASWDISFNNQKLTKEFILKVTNSFIKNFPFLQPDFASFNLLNYGETGGKGWHKDKDNHSLLNKIDNDIPSSLDFIYDVISNEGGMGSIFALSFVLDAKLLNNEGNISDSYLLKKGENEEGYFNLGEFNIFIDDSKLRAHIIIDENVFVFLKLRKEKVQNIEQTLKSRAHNREVLKRSLQNFEKDVSGEIISWESRTTSKIYRYGFTDDDDGTV
jgi:hypothetical protein